jgi:hypothetical protein
MGLLILFFVFVLSCYPVLDQEEHDNLYSHQAASWLEGKLDLAQPGTDVALYKEKLYVPFPPFPAVLLVPFVYCFGEERASPLLVAVFLTGINLLLLRSILRKIEQTGSRLVWLVAAIICGTGYWTETILCSGVWAFAHIVAVTALLSALNESLGRGRGWLVGICLGAAFLSRQLTVFCALFFCVALWVRDGDPRTRRILNQVGFGSTLCLAVGTYLIYNWARFDDPFQTGYGLIPLTGGLQNRFVNYGLFSPVYIPFNLTWFFLQGFQVFFGGDAHLNLAGVSSYGTSITFASPFLFLTFKAEWKRPLLWGVWLSTTIIFGIFMCYYNNGWVQLNTQRFSLDFIPLLVPLLAFGCQRVSPVLWKGLIAYSVGLNVLTVFLQFWLPYLGMRGGG